MYNVFVIGLDDFNLSTMRRLPEARRYSFHPLLANHRVKGADVYDLDELVAEAQAELEAFSGQIDAIVTWWDFPSTAIAAILCERWDLRGPSLRSSLVLENKYWGRVAQRSVVRPYVPAFAAFDPYDDGCFARIEGRGVTFPFWIKPVKSVSSYLGFRIESRAAFDEAIARLRESVHHYGDPFQQALDRVELPADVDAIGGIACIAEGLIGGRQCTLEGYVLDGRATVYGVIDSLRDPNGSTFASYRYPSRLPLPIRERMAQIAADVVGHAAFSEGCFNMELFYDDSSGHIWVLEVNTRLSQSHTDLFAKVDGVSHQRCMLDVALGRKPRMPLRQGPFGVAGKFFLRSYVDGVVRRVPSEHEVAEITRLHPGARLKLNVGEGSDLADLHAQDSYSYELGIIYLGDEDHGDLEAQFAAVRRMLRFEIEDRDGDRHDPFEEPRPTIAEPVGEPVA